MLNVIVINYIFYCTVNLGCAIILDLGTCTEEIILLSYTPIPAYQQSFVIYDIWVAVKAQELLPIWVYDTKNSFIHEWSATEKYDTLHSTYTLDRYYQHHGANLSIAYGHYYVCRILVEIVQARREICKKGEEL